MSYGALNCPVSGCLYPLLRRVRLTTSFRIVIRCSSSLCMSWQTVLTFKALYLTPNRLFLHDLYTGGPEDTSASLKCRVLFSVQFPFKDRKRKVHHHEVHPLAIFEAVSGRVLEQLMRTGMTSKGGIRPILTMEGKFHFTLILMKLGLTKECRSSFPCC